MHVSAPPIALLMVQLFAVVVSGRLLARVVHRLGQPTVIAEVVAGIVLGPSLLGLVWPEGLAALFPADTLPSLSLISQLGLVFFMFLVGLEFDPRLLQGRGHQSVVISHASILLPFLLGALLSWPLHATYAPEGVPFSSFALFMGVSMSITAFPVLARILAERGVLRTRIGAITLSCAAVDDVTAWCILAFVVSIARAEGIQPALVTTGLALVYVVVMIGLVRPVLARLGPREGSAIAVDAVAITFVLLLISATTTELIGIHALFGGFLFGAVMPRTGGLTQAITEKIEDFVTIVLLPLFFAYSGLRTRIGLLDSLEDWGVCGVIIVVACLGKFGGSALAARITGLGWREAGAVGVLMNTRGLMELIVLNVGLDLGVLSPRLFTMMVIMALVTTWLTSPLLERIYPRREMLRDLEQAPEPADDASPGVGLEPNGPRPGPLVPALPRPTPALICVSDPALVPALLAVGRRLVGPTEALTALHIVRSDRPAVYLRGGPSRAAQEPLDVLLERAATLGVPVRPLSFIAADPAQDIVRVAEAKDVGVVLLGTHREVLVEGALAGVVGHVLAAAKPDVAVLMDHGLRDVRRMHVVGADPAVTAVAARLAAAGVVAESSPSRDSLLVAPLGTTVPPGVSALLVRPRPR